MAWKPFSYYWPLMTGINQSQVDSPHQNTPSLVVGLTKMLNRVAGDAICFDAHVTSLKFILTTLLCLFSCAYVICRSGIRWHIYQQPSWSLYTLLLVQPYAIVPVYVMMRKHTQTTCEPCLSASGCTRQVHTQLGASWRLVTHTHTPF